MAERPSLGRDDSYNRVRLPGSMKSQICSMIADSSESLPLATVSESEESRPATTDQSKIGPLSMNGAPNSSLRESTLSSDIPTPTPEKPNPLEQTSTVREDFAYVGEGDPLQTPSPVRSHEVTATHDKPLASRISKMVTESDADFDDEKGDNLGTTASRQTTVSETPSNASGNKGRPGLAGRSSTMKRISSAIKRTISKDERKQ